MAQQTTRALRQRLSPHRAPLEQKQVLDPLTSN